MIATPLVSIITIVYNGELYIEKTILSVLNQHYKPIQYIIIDGGSTDNTVPIIKKYAPQLHYWVSEEDNGISNAFNKGIAKATGEIIGIINASDWYEPDTVEQVVEACKNADIVYGKLRYWKLNEPIYIQVGKHELLKREMTVNHPTVFIKKQFYKDWGVFNEDLKCAMDYDLLLRFSLNGARFMYLNIILANMMLDGLSDKKWLLGCRETLVIKNKLMPQSTLFNYLYFLKHITAIIIPRILKKIGLSSIVKIYRTKFSFVRKEYTAF